MKRIGILGSSNVAKSLAGGFLKHGYEVKIGARNLDKLCDWKKENNEVLLGSFVEAASFGDIIVLAVSGYAAKEVLEKCGRENLKSKIIIDPTDPVDKIPIVDGVLSFFTDLKSSLMEELQAHFPDAHFVKSFNSIGHELMVNPNFGDTMPTMFICGNNDLAKQEVIGILEKFGWESEDIGKAQCARAIEPLCILWCARAFKTNQWSHAFKLIKTVQ